MYCLPKEDRVRCCRCGRRDIHWNAVKTIHDAWGLPDHYCGCSWSQCSSNMEHCSPLPTCVIVNSVYGRLWNPPINCGNVCTTHSDVVTKTLGKVDYFSKQTCDGLVKVGSFLYKFPSTCFVASDIPRYPRVGEIVYVMIRKINGEDVVIAMSSIK